jgi:hypothetical protein
LRTEWLILVQHLDLPLQSAIYRESQNVSNVLIHNIMNTVNRDDISVSYNKIN